MSSIDLSTLTLSQLRSLRSRVDAVLTAFDGLAGAIQPVAAAPAVGANEPQEPPRHWAADPARRAQAIAKIAEANRGKPKSAEHRAAISAANKGKIRTPEQRAAISAGKRASWAARRAAA